MDTREQLLDAAVYVIRTKGLSQATTKEIALAAHCSEGTLYRHFKDKESLFLAVFQERLPSFIGFIHDIQNRVGEKTVESNLEDFALQALDFLKEIVPVVASLFAEPQLLNRYGESLRTQNGGLHNTHEALAAYIQAEQQLGGINSQASPLGTAMLLLGACHQYAFIRHIMGGERVEDAIPVQHLVKELVHALMEGLSPRKE